MRLPSRLQVISYFAFIGLMIFGCSPARRVEGIEITFDGESCRYEGPDTFVEGLIVVRVNNPTDHQWLHIHVGWDREGEHTFEEVIEHWGALYTPNDPGPPPWASDIKPTALDGDPHQRYEMRYFREWEFTLVPGSYHILCAAHYGDPGEPRGLWLSAPFEVVAASPE